MSPRSGRDGAIAVLIALAVFGLQWPTRQVGISFIDEGAIFQIGAEILRGKLPYADAIHYAWPGVFYLTAAAFKLFGTSIESGRAVAHALFALTAATVYLLARWSHGRAWAFALVVVLVDYRIWAYPQWQMLNYSTMAVTWALLAVWVFGQALERDSRALVWSAGMVAGIALITKQDSGAATVIALGILAFVVALGPRVGRIERVLWLGTGVAATLLVTAFGSWLGGFLPSLIDETIFAPLFGARTFSYPGGPRWWPLFGQDVVMRRDLFAYFPPILIDGHGVGLIDWPPFRDGSLIDTGIKLAFMAPYVVIVAAIVVIVGRGVRGAGDRVERLHDAILLAIGLAFLAAFNRPRDWGHLLVLYIPTLLLGARLMSLWAQRAPARATVVRALGWSGVIAGTVLSVSVYRTAVAALQSKVTGPAGTLYGAAGQAEGLQGVLDAVRTRPPGAAMLALPYYPLVDFMADRTAASRYYAVWPVERNANRDDELIAGLEAHPETVVTYSTTQVPQFPPMPSFAPKLFDYLVDRYEIETASGTRPDGMPFFLLRRVPASTAVTLARTAIVTESDATGERTVLAADADDIVDTAWPFRRVLAFSTRPHTFTAGVFALTPAAGTHVRTSIGHRPDLWTIGPSRPVEFSARVGMPGGPARELFTATRDPFLVPADRSWQEVDLDLTPWAGQPVELELRVRAIGSQGLERGRVAWSVPQLSTD